MTDEVIPSAVPARPVSGDPITADWGNAVIDQIQGRWRFVPFGNGNVAILAAVPGNVNPQALELTDLPANDPHVMAAEVMGRIWDAAGVANWNGSICNFDDEEVMVFGWTSGVTAKGGGFGPGPVMVGGPNRRSIKWKTSNAGATFSLYLRGYWTTADA